MLSRFFFILWLLILPLQTMATSAGPNSPGTMATSNASGGISDWAYPDLAKVADGSYSYAEVGYYEDSLFSDTLISTLKGNKPIKDIKSGDLIYSYNFEKKHSELKPASNIRRTPISLHNNKLYHIYFQGGEIRATDNHLFYANNNLIRVKDLGAGDYLIGSDGGRRIITNITVEQKENIEVWNFSVDGNHNYFAEGILVHNVGTYDHRVRIIKEGAVGSTDRASANAWPSSFAYTTYGNSSDKWGETWTSSDINASDFGVAISAYGSGYWVDETTYYLKATNFGFSTPEGSTVDGITVEINKKTEVGSFTYYAEVDHIRITVYYTESSGNTITAAPSDTSVVLASNDSTDVTSEAQTGTQTIRLKYGAETPKPVVDFPFDFDTGNTDLSSLTINRDDNLKAAVIHGLASHTGVTASEISLYIPKDTSQNYLRYCSGKTTIGCTIADNWSAFFNEDGDVVSTNNGFDPSSLTVTVTSINGEDLWKITGPISSGGQGEAGVPDIGDWMMILLILIMITIAIKKYPSLLNSECFVITIVIIVIFSVPSVAFAGQAEVIEDPLDSSRSIITVTGSSVLVTGTTEPYTVYVGGVSQGSFSALPGKPLDRIEVTGTSGADTITIATTMTLSVWIFGGDDNDLLTGGGGNDVLLGGNGNDTLTGNAGQDLLIGGAGRDTITGNQGDDILIDGTTSYDANSVALWSLMSLWTNGTSYNERIVAACDTSNTYYLRGNNTVFADSTASDLLDGSEDTDMYFAKLYGDRRQVDRVSGVAENELSCESSNFTFTISATPSSSDVVLSSDGTDVTVSGQTSVRPLRVRYGEPGSRKVAIDFGFDFNCGSTDLSGVTVVRDDSQKAAIIHGLTANDGLLGTGNISLYVLKDTGHNQLRYCSGKETIGCTVSDSWSALWNASGEVVSTNGGFDASPFTVTITTVEEENVWKITGPISSGAQGEGEAGGNVIIALPSVNHAATLASNDTTDVTSEAQTGTQELYLKYLGGRAARFNFDFSSSNRDLSAITALRNESIGASVVHGLVSHEGVTGGSYVLYVPKLPDHIQLRVCSGKTTLGCTTEDNWSFVANTLGEIIETNGGFDTSGITVSISGSDWVVAGLTGSGGQGEGIGVPDIGEWMMIFLLISTAFVVYKNREILLFDD